MGRSINCHPSKRSPKKCFSAFAAYVVVILMTHVIMNTTKLNLYKLAIIIGVIWITEKDCDVTYHGAVVPHPVPN